jgi:hypothetical protein
MRPLLYPFLLLFSILSCGTPNEEEQQEAETPLETIGEKRAPIPQISIDIPDYQFEFNSLKLNENMDKINLSAFKHYGEFYTDDFTIYRLDRLDLLADSYYIDDINLYFIDSLLVKIQAFLREDKSSEFLRKYGKATISINNYRNKKLLEQENVLERVNGRLQINENIDQYTLKWKRQELDIAYAVNKQADSTASKVTKLLDDKNQRYKLTFQTKDFNNQMAWVKWEAYKESRGLSSDQ